MTDLLFMSVGARRTLGLILALAVVGCGSRALRRPGADALGTGGAVPGSGGASGDAGLAGTGGVDTGGSTSPPSDAATVSDPPAPDARTSADVPLPARTDAEMPDAGADAWLATGPDAAEVGFGEVGPQLAAFCVGSDSQISYGGKSYVIPVTTKWEGSTLDCCVEYEARLHAQEAMGEDIDVVLRLRSPVRAGRYGVGRGEREVTAGLHRSSELKYVERLMDSPLVGSVALDGAVEDPTKSWQLGLCVSLEAASSRWPGMLIYVPSARVAPEGWANRFRMWRLADASLTGQDVNRVDINTLALASEPFLDLMDIDFVELESQRCKLGAGTCTWMGLNTDFELGKKLSSMIGSRVNLSGLPFVVEADGERIYLGAFETLMSSYAIHGPEVMVEEISDEGFPIYRPANYRPTPPDRRNDSRIVKVFTEAGKIAP